MSTFLFLLAVAALVATSLGIRIVISKGNVGDLPPMPHEH